MGPDPQSMVDGQIPIVLGVTGHRVLENTHALRDTVEKDVAFLRKTYPHTPLVGISALAEGADRLLAEVWLAANIPLYVVLPFDASEYEKDFPDSIDAFRALCAQAVGTVIVPWAEGVNLDNIQTEDPANQVNRNLQYALTGIYISQRAHILFALWDGQPARGLGGTAQVVQYRRKRHLRGLKIPEDQIRRLNLLAPMNLLEDPGADLIRHIPTVSTEAPFEGGKPQWIDSHGRCRITLEQDGSDSSTPISPVAVQLRTLDAYNKTLANTAFGDAGGSGDEQKAARFGPEDDLLAKRFAQADTLANVHMFNVRRAFKRIFWLAGGTALSHELYIEGPAHWRVVMIWIYCLMLAAIAWQVWQIRRHRRNAEAVDYRALAEGLRVQQAWLRAGLVHQVANHYMLRYAGDLGWVRLALQGACLTHRREIRESDLEAVRDGWIGEQKAYLEGSLQRRENVIRNLSRYSTVFFLTGVVFAVFTLIVRQIQLFPEHSVALMALDLGFGLFPAAAGLLSGYLEFAAYEDDVREHRRIRALFDRAYRQMAAENLTLADRQRLVFELGLEALNENANWAILHKSHDAKAPLG